jgi:hypothetical protein
VLDGICSHARLHRQYFRLAANRRRPG